MVRTHLNQELQVSTILLTMYDSRTNLAAGVAAEVREHFREQVLKTAIPRSVRVSEAPSYGQSVMTYDPGSPGALCYLEAARELAQRGAPRAADPQPGARPSPRPSPDASPETGAGPNPSSDLGGSR
jgi:chromosome partitioning protein